MDLTVVVPTLNGRDRLAGCLDALAAHAPDAEVVVVNGPSADGTTGMVRDRTDVDVLVEISDRTVNVARNAGIEVATGDRIALVDYDNRIRDGWRAAVEDGLTDADVVTGPVITVDSAMAAAASDTTRSTPTSADAEEGTLTDANEGAPTDANENPSTAAQQGPERRRIAGRSVTYFAGGNVAFDRETLRDLDGFDEYLRIGGSRDAAHRLAQMDHTVAWRGEMAVSHAPSAPTAVDGGRTPHEWGWKYRALSYRLLKNYGIRPTVFTRAGAHAAKDAIASARDVVGGDSTPSTWAATGRDVIVGLVGGGSDGFVSRRRDRSLARNPNGISTRADRAVAKYDTRD